MDSHTKRMRGQTYWNSQTLRRKPWHPVIKQFVTPKLNILRHFVDNNKTNRFSIIDIGCGNGYFSYYLDRIYDTMVIDNSWTMLKKNMCLVKICGDANKLPIKNNAFDMSFCSNLLHHIENPNSVINEMKRIARRYIIISEPNRSNPFMFLFGCVKKEERGTLRYSKKFMENLIKKNNLIITYKTSIGSVLPNKTPKSLLPILKKIDGEFSLAFYNLIIAKKLN